MMKHRKLGRLFLFSTNKSPPLLLLTLGTKYTRCCKCFNAIMFFKILKGLKE